MMVCKPVRVAETPQQIIYLKSNKKEKAVDSRRMYLTKNTHTHTHTDVDLRLLT